MGLARNRRHQRALGRLRQAWRDGLDMDEIRRRDLKAMAVEDQWARRYLARMATSERAPQKNPATTTRMMMAHTIQK